MVALAILDMAGVKIVQQFVSNNKTPMHLINTHNKTNPLGRQKAPFLVALLYAAGVQGVIKRPQLLRVVRCLPPTTGLSAHHALNGQASDKPRGRKPRGEAMRLV
ncbi:MAG TPA: hypothetical protein ENH39_00540 [Gammaproteobacteria bacterium]|nr:hypothetical protein [Gammaproteobacteria bacterium]